MRKMKDSGIEWIGPIPWNWDLKKQKYVLYTVISIYEVKRAIKIINKVDPKAFITITNVNQVVGKFFIKPRK